MEAHYLFVTCSRYLEKSLAQELTELGFEDVREGFCGVYVSPATPEAIYKINYLSRLASRVLFPLIFFRCHDKNALYKAGAKFEWENWIKPKQTIAIDANVRHPNLRHSLYAAQVLKDGICDRLRDLRGERPSVSVRSPDVQLHLFIDQTKGIISFDTSGEALYRRGYKVGQAEAALQETVAAWMLRVAGYSGERSLADPCCGGGTILSEAYLIATKTPPGFFRKKWGFFDMPQFDRSQWEGSKAKWDALRRPLPKALTGIEKEGKALELCRKNLAFAPEIELHHTSFQKVDLNAELVVTNPPFGERVPRADRLLGDLREWISSEGWVLGETKSARAKQVSSGGKVRWLGRYGRDRSRA